METKQRLVDANELLKKAYYEDEEFVVDVDDIKAAQTIDAVEVVRCKDCKHHKILRDYRKSTLPVCGRKNLNVEMHENDFCSRGERKDGIDGSD